MRGYSSIGDGTVEVEVLLGRALDASAAFGY
jgi:hypothetical protein